MRAPSAPAAARAQRRSNSNAETGAAGRGRVRQERQDGGGRGGASLHAPAVQEDRAPDEEVPRARREERVQDRRSGRDRRKRADLEEQAVGGLNRGRLRLPGDIGQFARRRLKVRLGAEVGKDERDDPDGDKSRRR